MDIRNKFKVFKKSPKRFAQFNSSTIAAIFSGFPIAVLVAIIWKGPSYLDWQPKLAWIIGIIVTLIMLIFYYKLGRKITKPMGEEKSFHDNFYSGIISSIIVASAIIFHNLITWDYSIILGAVIFLVIYLLFLFLFFKYFKKIKCK